jgi:hypothetical protein
VARHGDDQSVFCRRQGKHTEPFERFRIADTMQLAAKAAEINEEYKPDAFFVDATGMGWGVVDRLRQLNVKNVIAVQTGEKAIERGEVLQPRRRALGRRQGSGSKRADACPSTLSSSKT